MKETVNFLAIDLGASNGRVLLGRWDGGCFSLEELHRFPNGPVEFKGHQHWDVLRLWREIEFGLARYADQFNRPLAGIGVDTWGVDFALLDAAGNLLGNPYHYRDSRTDGMMEIVFQRIPRQKIFEQTGIQFMQINTLYQLFSMAQNNDATLREADTLLMMADLFHYWLSGQKTAELTIATTSQMVSIRERQWASDLLDQLAIPTHVLPPIISSGTILGDLKPRLVAKVGLRTRVPIIATGSHDTASAVAAIPGLDDASVYISSGTWSLMGVELPEPIINDQVLSRNFTNEGGVDNTIRLLKNLSGLWLLQESRRRWQKDGQDYSWDAMMAMGEKAEPFRCLIDPDARDFLSPNDMPKAIRSYCHRTGQPEPTSVGANVRCCLESVAMKYRWVLEALETLTNKQFKTIRIVGGGSQNRLLSQFTADACQRPVVTGPVEATALGNVLLQAIAGGHLSDISAGRQAIAASVDRQYLEPRSGDAWEVAYGRFCKTLQGEFG
jgi:rhamnulokinase